MTRLLLIAAAAYLLVGVAIAVVLYRSMRDQGPLDRHDRLCLVSYVPCWPVVLLALWADWANPDGNGSLLPLLLLLGFALLLLSLALQPGLR